MKTYFIIIFLFITIKLSSQNEFTTTGPRIDTSYYFVIEIRPQDKVYEYYYSSKRDTLEFVTWQDKKRTSVKLGVNPNLKVFLIDKLIKGFDSLKIDNTHKPIAQSFDIFVQIGHNLNDKNISISDKFYLDKIYNQLLDFNTQLPSNAKFPTSFNLAEYKGKTDTTICFDIDHMENGEHYKDKIIIATINTKSTVRLNYFDQAENKRKFKEPIQFDDKNLKVLQTKTINYLNSFNIKSKPFTKSTDTLEVFGVDYSVPGFSFSVGIRSLEKAFQDKNTIEIINLLNSNLDDKFKFD